MLTIGLCGPEGAGKSTVAKILAEKHGAAIVPFAGPLKAMLGVLGVPTQNLYGNADDKAQPLELLGGRSARWALQGLGTQWGRMWMDGDFWVRAWASAVERARVARDMAGIGQPRMLVADDVRFQNEVDEIRNRGGMIITVVRDTADFNRTPAHASEDFAQIRADVLLINCGTVTELEAGVAEALSFRRSRDVSDAEQLALTL